MWQGPPSPSNRQRRQQPKRLPNRRPLRPPPLKNLWLSNLPQRNRLLLSPHPRASFKGTVVVGEWQEPKGLIGPIFYQAHTYAIINSMYYAPLALNENDELEPEMLAETPTLENGGISADGKTYTLKFKDGFKWHDGQPVTSADFKFTWEFIMNPDTKAQTTAGWNKVELIDTPDELTAVIHMREPYAPFVPTT